MASSCSRHRGAFSHTTYSGYDPTLQKFWPPKYKKIAYFQRQTRGPPIITKISARVVQRICPICKVRPNESFVANDSGDPPSLETYNDGDDPNMWSKSFRSMIKMCLQKDPNKQPTCQELLAHKHFRPLESEEGRAEWRQRTKQELCDVVEDSGHVR